MVRHGPVPAACAARGAARINWIMMWVEFLSPPAHIHRPSEAQLAIKKRLATARMRLQRRVVPASRSPSGKRASTMIWGTRPSIIWQYQPARRSRPTHCGNMAMIASPNTGTTTRLERKFSTTPRSRVSSMRFSRSACALRSAIPMGLSAVIMSPAARTMGGQILRPHCPYPRPARRLTMCSAPARALHPRGLERPIMKQARASGSRKESGMKVFAWAASLILGAAIIVVATEAGSKTDTGMCRVVCTPEPAAKPIHHTRARSAVSVRHRASHHASGHHRVLHLAHHMPRHAHHYARRDYYSYREAEAVRPDEWHGRWPRAPNDAMMPPP